MTLFPSMYARIPSDHRGGADGWPAETIAVTSRAGLVISRSRPQRTIAPRGKPAARVCARVRHAARIDDGPTSASGVSALAQASEVYAAALNALARVHALLDLLRG
jgi:hypothetical protein